MRNDKPITVPLDDETIAQLKDRAAANDRAVGREAAALIKEGLKRKAMLGGTTYLNVSYFDELRKRIGL